MTAPLPPWLRGALADIHRTHPAAIRSPAGCVAAAAKFASLKQPATGRRQGFPFDRREYAADVNSVRDAWLAGSPLAECVPVLAEKLARLEALEHEFERTLETRKLDSLKELAYGAGHEINNPLANISARAQTLLHQERDPERRRVLAAINTQAFRAHEMIADMMLFARPPRPQARAIDLVEVLREIADELASVAAAQRSQLLFHAPHEPVVARADKTQIAVAVRALCSNALEALVDGGRVELSIRRLQPEAQAANSRATRETVQITVADDGPGIAPEARPHIFDPFYSGREAGRGLGLGLSKCWQIVRMHEGQVDVESASGRGARFTISLPAAGVAC
jgi:signal transduction histidine kinase